LINSNIKVVDLDGMVIKTKSFAVDFEITCLARNTRNVIIYLRPSGKVIHSSNYTDEDDLSVLIESMEVEAKHARDDDEEQMYLDIARYLESIGNIINN